jgi:hypothetical protein
MTSATFEEFLVHLDCQMGAKNRKILPFIDQCAARPRDITALKNIKVIFFPPNCTSHLQPLHMGTIQAFKCQNRRQLIWKVVAVLNGELLGEASKMINLLIALHFIAEASRQVTPVIIENCFKKCGFFIRW